MPAMSPRRSPAVKAAPGDGDAALAAGAAAPPPRLLDRMRHAIRVRHFAIRTEQTYVDWARRFILFHGKRHPLEMGAPEVEAFLTHLAVERGVAPATQSQAPGWCAPAWPRETGDARGCRITHQRRARLATNTPTIASAPPTTSDASSGSPSSSTELATPNTGTRLM